LKEYIEAKQETNSEAYKEPPAQSHSQVKELKRVETSSPHGELKTPILSSLDSRIKKTIFFEAFKDEAGIFPTTASLIPTSIDKLPALGPTRQKSDIVDTTTHKKSLTGSVVHDFSRRRSYQPGIKGIDKEEDEVLHDKEMAVKQGKIMDKFKSIEVIYQEGNSAHSNSYQNYPFQKRPADLQDIKVDIEFDPNLSYQTPHRPQRQDLQSPDFPNYQSGNRHGGVDPKTGDQSLAEPSSPQAQTPNTKEVNANKNVINVIPETPKSKKLDIHIVSAPLRPKMLDTALDNPDRGSTIVNMSDFKSNANLIESIIVSRAAEQQRHHQHQKSEDLLEIPENPMKSVTPTRFAIGGKKDGLNSIQLHQLQDQLDTLAAETLKIIDEIRNKKRNTLTTTNDLQYFFKGKNFTHLLP